MKTKTIKDSVVLAASPRDVYDMIMDSKKHTAFTGAKAKMSSKVNGKFTAYDGYITGKNLKLVPGKTIVQEWHASDWDKEAMSTVTFAFTKTKTGTKLAFSQTGVPAEQYADIKQGWKDYYWSAMKSMIAASPKPTKKKK